MGNYLLVATPTAGNLVTAGYGSTLMAIARAARDAGWDFDNLAFDGADVVMARNFLANHVMQDKRLSHILFLDSDMRVSQSVITRFLSEDKPILGSVYPRRHIDLGRYGAALKAGYSDAEAQALAMDFNVKITASSMQVRDGICEVHGIGFGCVLIKRELLEEMARSGVARKVPSGVLKAHGLDDNYFDFFSTLPLKDGGYMSEDFSFCTRVRQMEGGTIWAFIGEGVAHLGGYSYEAAFETQLIARQKARNHK